MSKQDRKSYEASWQEAFQGAEMAPSEGVWQKVELEVTRSANSGYKKRILFFKLMAAASVAFAAAVIGTQYFYNPFNPNSNQSGIAQVDSSKTAVEEVQEADDTQMTSTDEDQGNSLNNPSGDNQVQAKVSMQDRAITPDKSKNITSEQGTDSDIPTPKNTIPVANGEAINSALIAKEEGDKSNVVNSNSETTKTNATFADDPASSSASTLAVAYEDADYLEGKGVLTDYPKTLLDLELNMVPRTYLAYASSNQSNQQSWVGIGVGYGQNNPSGNGNSSSAFSEALALDGGQFNVQSPVVSNEQPGSLISVGIGVGKEINNRWVVESGLNYITRTTLVESNLVSASTGGLRAVSSNAELTDANSLQITNNYTIENNYTSVMIPLQAGYKVIDTKFDITVKAGFANELLLQNRVEDQSGQFETQTISSGEGAQFNTYLLSGLVGTEFSYLLNDHYHLSITPQLRRSFNSFLKDQESSGNHVSAFTLGFQINYLFR